MTQIIKGKKLMLFASIDDGKTYKSIACATSHSLSLSTSTTEISTKDDADATGGRWQDQDIDMLSWTASTENLVAVAGEGHGIDDLLTLYLNGKTVKLRMQLAALSPSGVPTGGWASDKSNGVPTLSGEAIISSFQINASNGDNATFTCEFTGKGRLSKGVTA